MKTASSYADLLLLTVLLTNLAALVTTRLKVAIRIVALQGAVLALLPFAFASRGGEGGEEWALGMSVHSLIITGLTLALKTVLIPFLLNRSVRIAKVKRELEPFIGLKVSMYLGAALIGIAFWMGSLLVLPRPAPSSLLVPVALATLFIGFLVVVSRRKAITQVLGYLMLENGIYVFGLCLAREMPLLVELGILLDLLVGVFVMGIAIHHISREFEAIDTDEMATLKD